jgi:phosphomannomutase
MFFNDRYYGFDDAIYASFRLLEIIGREGKSLAQLLADLTQTCFTPACASSVQTTKNSRSRKAAKYF